MRVLFAVFSLVFFPGFAFAAPDYSAIIAAIDWSSTLIAVASVFAGLAGVAVLITGSQIILNVIDIRRENRRDMRLPGTRHY